MRRGAKRAVKITLAVVGVAVALAFILPPATFLVFGPLANNIKAHSVRSEIRHYELPSDAEMVDAGSWVGNTGNGNHTEIVGGAIIRGDLTQAELSAALDSEAAREFRIDPLPIDPEAAYWLGDLFPDLGADGGRELVASAPGNWFFCHSTFQAFTQMDIRGH
ncbi:MAG: hypothetical protein LBG11_04675 [Bifidobacteriaceae bacterium]|jgi:hypothetical protein|nr:hypothetical protein [Bifidobacteriaceae bacterium]